MKKIFLSLLTIGILGSASFAAEKRPTELPGFVDVTVSQIRGKAAATAPIVALLRQGDQIVVTATSPDRAWVQVRKGGVSGWVKSSHVYIGRTYKKGKTVDIATGYGKPVETPLTSVPYIVTDAETLPAKANPISNRPKNKIALSAKPIEPDSIQELKKQLATKEQEFQIQLASKDIEIQSLRGAIQDIAKKKVTAPPAPVTTPAQPARGRYAQPIEEPAEDAAVDSPQTDTPPDEDSIITLVKESGEDVYLNNIGNARMLTMPTGVVIIRVPKNMEAKAVKRLGRPTEQDSKFLYFTIDGNAVKRS